MKALDRDNPGAIVIGDHVQGLGIIRSLGRHGIPTFLMNDRSLCIGRFSKYVSKFFLCPSIEQETQFIDYLINLAEKTEDINNWVLFPTNDAAVRNLSLNKTRLEEYYTVPSPPWEVIRCTYNKKITNQIAERCGIPIPRTYYPKDEEEVLALSKELEYPVIIKPAVMHTFYTITKAKVIVVSSADELIKGYRTAIRIIDPTEVMVQEIIPGAPGELYSYCPFFKDGEAVAMCMGRRYRQRPMDFGRATTYVESCYVPELVDYGNQLLKEIQYYGLCEVEFKKDPRDGQFKLLEVNPRTWLWHSLSYRCGTDLPYLLYRDQVTSTVPPANLFREGIKWVHFYTDISISAKEICGRRLTINDYLKSLSGEKEYAVFSQDDIGPFIVETLLLPYLFIVR